MSFPIPHGIPEHTGMYFSVVWLAGYPARTERNAAVFAPTKPHKTFD
jgi:hypothetical protein